MTALFARNLGVLSVVGASAVGVALVLGPGHPRDPGAGRTAVEDGRPGLRWSGGRRAAGLSLAPFSLPFVNRDGAEFTYPNPDDNTLYVFVLFTFADCYAAFADVHFWSDLERELEGQVNVVGVTTGQQMAAARYFLDKQGVTIPVLYDEARAVFDDVERVFAVMPPVMVLARSSGNVLRIDGLHNGSREAQARYVSDLRAAMGETRTGGVHR